MVKLRCASVLVSCVLTACGGSDEGDAEQVGSVPVDAMLAASLKANCNVAPPALPAGRTREVILLKDHKTTYAGAESFGSALAASGSSFPVLQNYELIATRSDKSSSSEAQGLASITGPLGDKAMACAVNLRRPLPANASMRSYYGGWNVQMTLDGKVVDFINDSSRSVWGGFEVGTNFRPRQAALNFTLPNAQQVLKDPAICQVYFHMDTNLIKCVSAKPSAVAGSFSVNWADVVAPNVNENFFSVIFISTSARV